MLFSLAAQSASQLAEVCTAPPARISATVRIGDVSVDIYSGENAEATAMLLQILQLCLMILPEPTRSRSPAAIPISGWESMAWPVWFSRSSSWICSPHAVSVLRPMLEPDRNPVQIIGWISAIVPKTGVRQLPMTAQ